MLFSSWLEEIFVLESLSSCETSPGRLCAISLLLAANMVLKHFPEAFVEGGGVGFLFYTEIKCQRFTAHQLALSAERSHQCSGKTVFTFFFSFLFFIRWCRKGHFRADVKRTGLLRYEEISSSQKMQVYSRLNLDFLRCSVARTEMWSLGSGHSLTPIAIYYISPHTVWLTYQKSFRVLTTPRFRSNRHVC